MQKMANPHKPLHNLRITTLIVLLCFLFVKFKHFIDLYSEPLKEDITFIWLYFFIYSPLIIGAFFLFYTHIRALIFFSMVALLYGASATIETFSRNAYFLSALEASLGFLLFVLLFFYLKIMLKQKKAQASQSTQQHPIP
jgi:uncharacterized membrane protein